MISGQYIKKLAENAGFDLCGITPCKHLAENESYFREWLAKGYGSSLEYLERNLDKRFDVRHLVEGAQTVVVCAVSYKNPLGEGYPPGCRTKIASYARSRDYHPVLKRMLGTMLEALRRQYPGLTGRTFVDTAPLLEKQLAVEAGLGWIGRQSLLLTPPIRLLCPAGRVGTYPAVRPIRCPVRRSPLRPCRNCLDSCPTGAIVAPKVIDTNRCISCRTIEKESDSALPDLDGWIFGCDRCQSCCPHNQKAPMHRSPHFDPLFDPLTISDREWLAMSEEEFLLLFGNTPLARSGLRRIQQNVRINQEKNEE